MAGVVVQFQSTHPVRGATEGEPTVNDRLMISIHAPREGCDRGGRHRHPRVSISIHAPREGCDFLSVCNCAFCAFQSTHPVRGATARIMDVPRNSDISIHAPREGCDVNVGRDPSPYDRFQSTHPVRGATTRNSRKDTLMAKFQSTHPVRGATTERRVLRRYIRFQSTHPVRGATPAVWERRSTW